MSGPPRHCDIAVIGAGPAGSSAAALLARDGFDVVVLERARHPRPMVGESLIPHFWKYTDLTGATPAIEAEGFVAKAGGITVWDGEIHRIRFADFGFERPALHVERDVFDHLLLRHAERCGARVFEQMTVTDVVPGEEIRLRWSDRRANLPAQGSLRCRYLVDASGAASLVARRLGLAVGTEADPDLHRPDDPAHALGFNTMYAFVERFYQSDLIHNVFFEAHRDAAIKQAISELLAGNLWSRNNPWQETLLRGRFGLGG